MTNLSPGLSVEEVQNRLEVRLKHGFTAGVDSNQFLCVVLQSPEKSAFFYLLFRNAGFSGTLRERRVEFERKKDFRGVPAYGPKPIDSEETLRAVLNHPFLTAVEIKELMESWAAAADKVATIGASEPSNVWPAFALTWPIGQVRQPAISKARKEAARLIEQYDPFKIRIGMSREEVHSLVGAPYLSENQGDAILEAYGTQLPSDASLPVSTADPPLAEANKIFLSIVFQDEKAIRVFSHDFFDTRLEKRK